MPPIRYQIKFFWGHYLTFALVWFVKSSTVKFDPKCDISSVQTDVLLHYVEVYVILGFFSHLIANLRKCLVLFLTKTELVFLIRKKTFFFLTFSRSHLQKTVESYYVKGLVPVRDRKSKWLWLKWPWKSKFSWGLRVDAELIIFLGLLNDLAKPSE